MFECEVPSLLFSSDRLFPFFVFFYFFLITTLHTSPSFSLFFPFRVRVYVRPDDMCMQMGTCRFRKAIELAVQVFGLNHAAVAKSYSNYGRLLFREGQLDKVNLHC
mmetsp:Transcript_25555/g.64102  ORF Transcript_25555/g.64102 Transcript_25555/m.64102 type:complete len:106 (-) Transcript_25555:236-553(-)